MSRFHNGQRLWRPIDIRYDIGSEKWKKRVERRSHQKRDPSSRNGTIHRQPYHALSYSLSPLPLVIVCNGDVVGQ